MGDFAPQYLQRPGGDRIAYRRIDGQGPGLFWLSGFNSDDARAAFDSQTSGPQIVIGSSAGGWIALHPALDRPERVAGLILLAPATDFTEAILWPRRRSAIC